MNSYALPPTAISALNPAPTPSAYSSRSGNGEAPDGFARMLDQASATTPTADAPRPTGGADSEASAPPTRSPAAAPAKDGAQGDNAASASDGQDGKATPVADDDAGPTRKPRGPVRAGVLPVRTTGKSGVAQDVSEALNRVDLAAAASDAVEEALAAAAASSDTLATTPGVLSDAAAAQPGVLPATTQPGWDAQALLGTWAARPQPGEAAGSDIVDARQAETAGVQASDAGRAVFGQMARDADLASDQATAGLATPAGGTQAAATAAAASPVLQPNAGPAVAAAVRQTAAEASIAEAAEGLPESVAGPQSGTRVLPLQAAQAGNPPPAASGPAPATLVPAAQTAAAPLATSAVQLATSSSEGTARNPGVATAVQTVSGPRRDSLAQATAASGSTATAATAAADAGGERPVASSGVAAGDGAASPRSAGPLEDRQPAVRWPAVVDGHAALAAAAAGLATQAVPQAASEGGRDSRSELPGVVTASAATPVAQPPVLAWVAPAAGAPAPTAGPADGRIAASPGTPEFAPQLAAHVTTFVRDGLQHARLELNPAEMGPLTVQIQLDGNAARVHLAAENAQTRQALEQAMPQLAGSLRENGLTLSGGGVFEQPRQPQQQAQQQAGQRGEARDGGTTGQGRDAAGSAAASAASAPPARRRAGVVDLVA